MTGPLTVNFGKILNYSVTVSSFSITLARKFSMKYMYFILSKVYTEEGGTI